MKNIFLATGAVCILLINGSAFAAEKSKGQDTAEFRVKVAVCKATAKDDKVKTNDVAFYSYMAACIGKVNVNVAVASVDKK